MSIVVGLSQFYYEAKSNIATGKSTNSNSARTKSIILIMKSPPHFSNFFTGIFIIIVSAFVLWIDMLTYISSGNFSHFVWSFSHRPNLHVDNGIK